MINADKKYIYDTKIDEIVCPPNISETVAVRIMKLEHRSRVHFINFTKNNSANQHWSEEQIDRFRSFLHFPVSVGHSVWVAKTGCFLRFQRLSLQCSMADARRVQRFNLLTING